MIKAGHQLELFTFFCIFLFTSSSSPTVFYDFEFIFAAKKIYLSKMYYSSCRDLQKIWKSPPDFTNFQALS